MNKFTKFIEQISKKPLTLIVWVVIVIAVVWGISKVITYIKNYIDEQRRFSDNKINSSNLTYEGGAYITMADQLYNAMNGLGTNEDAIMRVINKIQTADDWNKLVVAFGVRKASFFLSRFEGDLYSWLQDELSSYWIDKINAILRVAGVTRLV